MTIEDIVRAIVREEIAAASKGAPAPVAPAASPTPRGRGRPAKNETPPSAPPVAALAAPAEADPFAPTPVATAPVPSATLQDVRAALTALRAATSQENALAALKAASGVDNLTALPADKYGAVVAAATKALPQPVAATTQPEDPFATPAAAPALTLEDVKAAVVKASKRSGQDRAAQVVMALGGTAPMVRPDGSTGVGPSWTALPKEQYAEAIRQLEALPTTK